MTRARALLVPGIVVVALLGAVSVLTRDPASTAHAGGPERQAPSAGSSASPTPTGSWASPALDPSASPAGTSAAPAAPAPDCRRGGAVVTTTSGRGRTVALTFDDGPDAATGRVLDTLHALGVHATFFVVGRNVVARPDLVQRAVAEGHLVGNHSWHHAYPSQVAGGWSAPYLEQEIDRTSAAIERASGERTCWFRPPGGTMTRTVVRVSRSRGLGVALWSVDPRDWALQDARHPSGMSPEAIGDVVARRATAGIGQAHPVVLLHDGGGPREGSLAAITTIVARYRAAGYTFVRLDGRP